MAHIADHLSVEELGRRARTSADACAARHYQAIWLLAQGQTVLAAAVTAFVTRWLEQLAHRYNQFGPEATAVRTAAADLAGNGKPAIRAPEIAGSRSQRNRRLP